MQEEERNTEGNKEENLPELEMLRWKEVVKFNARWVGNVISA